MTSSRQFGVHLRVLGSGALVGLAFRLIHSAIIARLLGVAEVGHLAAAVTFSTIVSQINDLGLSTALPYHYRRAPGTLPSLLRAVAMNFVLGCGIAVAVAMGAAHLPLPFADDLRRSFGLTLGFAALIAITTPSSILPPLVTAAGEYRSYVRLSNLHVGLQAALPIVSCVVFGPSYLYALGGLIAAQCVAIAAYLWYLRDHHLRAPAEALSAREIYAFGLRAQWGVIMKLFSSRADLLVVGAVLPASQVGLYSIGINLRENGLLPQTIYAAPYQNMVIDRAKPGGGSDRQLVLTGLILQAGLSLVMVAVAVVAFPLLIPIVYGPAFAPAVGPAVVLFASVAFLGPVGVCWMTFNAKGHPQLTSLVLTAGGLLGPVFTYIMLRAGYGLYGASLAGVVTAALTLGLSVYILARLQGYRWPDVVDGYRRALALTGDTLARARAYLPWPRQKHAG